MRTRSGFVVGLWLALTAGVAAPAGAEVRCGDNTCSAGQGENCFTCPADCACPAGTACEAGQATHRCVPAVCGPGLPPCPQGSLCFHPTTCPEPPCAGFCIPLPCPTPCPAGTTCNVETRQCETGEDGGGGSGTVVDLGVEIYHADPLGSVRLVTDASGTPLARYDYLPFGEEIEPHFGGRAGVPGYDPDTARQVPRRFTGKERDRESGLDYFGARYYSAAAGRFITTDPLLASARLELPASWNRYAYVINNPLRYVDPDGRQFVGGDGSAAAQPCHSAADCGAMSAAYQPLGQMMAGSAPWVGEAADAYTIVVPSSSRGERILAVVSLGANVLTLGVLPNFGTASKVLKGAADAPGRGPAKVYRGGSSTADNLTPRPIKDAEGLSTWDSLEKATPPGGKAQVIDTSKLKELCAVCDVTPEGHVSIRPGASLDPATLKRIEDWAATRGTGQVHPLTKELIEAASEVRRPR